MNLAFPVVLCAEFLYKHPKVDFCTSLLRQCVILCEKDAQRRRDGVFAVGVFISHCMYFLHLNMNK